MQTQEKMEKAYLLLADGTVYEGLSMGAKGTTIGEVAFTTGMVGYQETLTDPGYYGQIVAQTFPLVGNYGVNAADVESSGCFVKGYIVREWCETPSNFRCEHTLDWFLQENGVVGICDIDTRALTRRLREQGVMNGMITTADVYADKAGCLTQLAAYAVSGAARAVTVAAPVTYPCEAPCGKVALLDYGCKRSLRDALLGCGCAVTALPCTATAADIRAGGYDGVVLSNGPGDPNADAELLANLQEIATLGLPVFGVGLGHQLLALAMGARTRKMKHGHRGANQPVICLESGRTCITGQNHGYTVESESVAAAGGVVTHVNANDRGCEGISFADGRMFGVQFHPSADCASDTAYLFDRFTALLQDKKGGN